jgi:hypothetical protein
MLIQRIAGLGMLCLLCGLLTSCSEEIPQPAEQKKVPVTPVTGTITVDGAPQAGIEIGCVPVGTFSYGDLSAKMLHGTTNEKGEFALGTYDLSDGVPAGEYSLTFSWPIISLIKQEDTKKAKSDRLKGKYSTAKNSPKKIKVEEGKPLQVEALDLKTK